MPVEIVDLLIRYREHQTAYMASIGNKWVEKIQGLDDKMVDNNRLFTQWHGVPMHPNAPSLYFERFCNKYGIRYLNGHSLRHLHASVEISAGVDVKTLQMIMGHSSANTTVNATNGHTHREQAIKRFIIQ
jgi:integrase